MSASAPHLTTIRVYYEDTDFSGFVYHAGYLRFMERGRTEFLRALGITQSRLRDDEAGLVFVVSRLSVDYLRPARMDDMLTVETTLAACRGAAMRLSQRIVREAVPLLQAEVTVAAVRDGRPVRLPAALRAATAGLAGGSAREADGT